MRSAVERMPGSPVPLREFEDLLMSGVRGYSALHTCHRFVSLLVERRNELHDRFPVCWTCHDRIAESPRDGTGLLAPQMAGMSLHTNQLARTGRAITRRGTFMSLHFRHGLIPWYPLAPDEKSFFPALTRCS